MKRVPKHLREAVLERDGQCFLYTLDQKHQCRDRFGPHAPDDRARLTMDHVNAGGGKMGKEAETDLGHMVAMCWAGNTTMLPKSDPFWTGPTRWVREQERAHLGLR